MSCPCLIPQADFPGTAEWGPLLWCLLHGLAERAGSPTTPMFLEDERRAWLNIFKETGEMIPCPTCKSHYQEYLKANPVIALKSLPHSERKDWVRRWFWKLHNSVNSRLGKPEFSYDNLLTSYKSVKFHEWLTRLDAPIRTAIKLTGTQLIKYTEWKRRFTMMLSIFGI